MRRACVLVLIAACGSAPTPAPKPVIAVTPEKKTPSTEPTCADMGPLLRRAFAPDGADDSILETIAEECTSQQWSGAVLSCVAAAPELKANDCLSKLDGKQTESLNTNIARYTSWGEGYDLADLRCTDVLKATDVADWNPPVQGEEQRELARELRRPVMLPLCDQQPWEPGTVSCVSEATDPASLEACAKGMDPGVRKAIDDAVVGADVAQKKMTTVMGKSAAGYTCEKAVAAHYAAAKWKGHAPTIVGGSRTKAIAASKEMMADACNAETWSAEVRACIVAVDEPVCWKLAKMTSDEDTWAYPADGTVPFATGVAECDDWGAEVTRVMGCEGLPEEVRKSLRGTFNSVKGGFKELNRLPKETAKATWSAVATSCGQARDSVIQVAQNAGC